MTIEKKQEKMNLAIIVLLWLNVLFGIYIAFFKRDALRLETLKVGGAENMAIAEQLYSSPAFAAQGKQQLEEGLKMFQGAADTTAQNATTWTVPTVTQ